MQFTNPIALWGLTGLLIPIGIHLLSRKEGKIFKIGSIRHLDDTNTRQFKSIRLNETGLLVLRCLLITVLVFLLSGLHFSFIKDQEKWLLIENGLEKDSEFSSLIDSLGRNGYKIKLLSKDFPALEDATIPPEKINYWQLVDALKAQPLNNAIVVSYNYLKGFNGRQTYLPDNIQWLTKTKEPVEFPLYAMRLSRDSVFVRVGKGNEVETSFTSTVNAKRPDEKDEFAVEVESMDTISISIVSDSSFSNDKLIINTALNVLDEKTTAVFHSESFTPMNFKNDEKTDWIIWISTQPFNPTLQANSIHFSTEVAATNLFILENHRREYSSWILTKRLNAAIALEENLTLRLGQILLPTEKYLERMHDFDRRILPEKIAWSERKVMLDEGNAIAPTSSSTEILVVIVLMILVLERFLAFKRNQ